MSDEQKYELHEVSREHVEGLGDPWTALLGNPAAFMSQVVGTVLQAGGTRPSWQVKHGEEECTLMAWPQDSPIRAAVLMRGQTGGELAPVTAVPLLEGAPNDMTIEDLYPWENGVEAHVGACRNEGARPLWFYTPFYFRDKAALMTPGVRHTVLLAGLAYGVRRALLDDMTIASGPRFEDWAEHWLAENPEKTRLDVPPLKISLRGSCLLLPSPHYTVYQLRAPVLEMEECKLHEEPVRLLRIKFGLDTPEPLDLPLYVPERVCKNNYAPKAGDEIDAIMWLQGRLLD